MPRKLYRFGSSGYYPINDGDPQNEYDEETIDVSGCDEDRKIEAEEDRRLAAWDNRANNAD